MMVISYNYWLYNKCNGPELVYMPAETPDRSYVLSEGVYIMPDDQELFRDPELGATWLPKNWEFCYT
jgi:hypothetical protein